MKGNGEIKSIVTALSLSNLCFLAAWRQLLYPAHKGYLLQEVPEWMDYVALMLDVLLLAALFWIVFTILHNQRQKRLAIALQWMFLSVTLIALNFIRIQAFGHVSARGLIAVVGKFTFIATLSVTLCLIVFVLIRWLRQVVHIAQVIILIFAPFTLLTFSKAASALMQAPPVTADARGKSDAVGAGKRRLPARILWIVFDELDYRASFISHPSSIKLPELDRLRSESLFATNAYPPAGYTLQSMPALITGKFVAAAREVNPNELMLTFEDSTEPVSWSNQPNIFSSTQELGGTTAAVGWYHPYCRVIGDTLTKCSWSEIGYEQISYSHNLLQGMLDYASTSALNIPLVRDWLPKLLQNEKRDSAAHMKFIEQGTLEKAKEVAGDASLSMILIHYPAPHPPCSYNRWRNDFSTAGDCDYFDNLVLVDRTLGELRRAMESAGVWDQTTVLVSSDHWWRINIWATEHPLTEEEATITGGKMDYRVPFILKLKDQNEPIIYNPEFNTIITHDLFIALLHGELSKANEVVTWLDKQPTRRILPIGTANSARGSSYSKVDESP